jgi:hypothetical protein
MKLKVMPVRKPLKWKNSPSKNVKKHILQRMKFKIEAENIKTIISGNVIFEETNFLAFIRHKARTP